MQMANVKKSNGNLDEIQRLCNEATLHEIGVNGDKDLNRALKYYHEAAELGSMYAKSKVKELSKLKANGGIVDPLDSHDDTNELDLALDRLEIAEAENTSAAEHKILVIDDAPDALLLLKKILGKRECETLTASGGPEALKLIEEHDDFDCIFVDLQMPEMNGFQFIKTLKGKKLLTEVPIIVETAHTNKDLIDMGIKLGIKAWLKKPLEISKVLQVYDKVLGEHE